MSKHVLVARLDGDGEVLLAGPAVRAVAAGASRVTFLCGPRGRAAAELLPGVDEVLAFDAPWIGDEAPPVDQGAMLALVGRVAALCVDQAVVLTSASQSPLPLALLLRMAWVPEVAAISAEAPGTLLDVRPRVPADVHEVERNLSLVRALGYELPAGDDGRLRIDRVEGKINARLPAEPYVVVHPGAGVPARAWPAERNAETVVRLADLGWHVVVTGSLAERALVARVAGPLHPRVHDFGGRTDLAGLAEVLAGAACLVAGNTAPAHVAAAVGTPVVSLFAPTVSPERWRPWRVPQRVLGHHDIGCAGCGTRVCPVEGQPCLAGIRVDDVVEAVTSLAGDPPSQPCRAQAAS